MRGPALPILAALALAGCEDAGLVPDAPGSTTPAYERAADAGLAPPRVPVRIGESGANFPACTALGTSRRTVAPGETLIVRTAPFDAAAESARLPAGGRFFICARSLDQKWLGVVFDNAGAANPACGVAAPIARRQDYAGPCRSGWVPSALVKQSAL